MPIIGFRVLELDFWQPGWLDLDTATSSHLGMSAFVRILQNNDCEEAGMFNFKGHEHRKVGSGHQLPLEDGETVILKGLYTNGPIFYIALVFVTFIPPFIFGALIWLVVIYFRKAEFGYILTDRRIVEYNQNKGLYRWIELPLSSVGKVVNKRRGIFDMVDIVFGYGDIMIFGKGSMIPDITMNNVKNFKKVRKSIQSATDAWAAREVSGRVPNGIGMASPPPLE